MTTRAAALVHAHLHAVVPRHRADDADDVADVLIGLLTPDCRARGMCVLSSRAHGELPAWLHCWPACIPGLTHIARFMLVHRPFLAVHCSHL